MKSSLEELGFRITPRYACDFHKNFRVSKYERIRLLKRELRILSVFMEQCVDHYSLWHKRHVNLLLEKERSLYR